jgi:1,4-dihydroxy-2-naphthoate octaprenyltransferase
MRLSVRLERKDTTMLWTIVLIILALWVLGLIGSIGGSAIHLLLVLAAIVLIAQLVSGRRTV